MSTNRQLPIRIFHGTYEGCQNGFWETVVMVIREGRSVSFSGRKYEFLTVEQAMGFTRFLQQGKTLEHACKIWKPKRIMALPASTICRVDNIEVAY